MGREGPHLRVHFPNPSVHGFSGGSACEKEPMTMHTLAEVTIWPKDSNRMNFINMEGIIHGTNSVLFTGNSYQMSQNMA